MMNDTSNLDGLRPAYCCHGGLTVLFHNATQRTCGNGPYSHQAHFSHTLEQGHSVINDLRCASPLLCAIVL